MGVLRRRGYDESGFERMPAGTKRGSILWGPAAPGPAAAGPHCRSSFRATASDRREAGAPVRALRFNYAALRPLPPLPATCPRRWHQRRCTPNCAPNQVDRRISYSRSTVQRSLACALLSPLTASAGCTAEMESLCRAPLSLAYIWLQDTPFQRLTQWRDRQNGLPARRACSHSSTAQQAASRQSRNRNACLLQKHSTNPTVPTAQLE